MSVLEAAFIKILNMSLTAGIVICIVFLIRVLLCRIPKIFSYILWMVVLFRLLCPVSFSSTMSFFNILRLSPAQQGEIAYIPENIGYMEQPALNLPVPAIENAVNGFLPPASVETSVNPMQIVLWLGGCVWLSGIIIMTLYTALSFWKLRGKLKEAVWEEDNIYITEAVETPFVCGFFAPRIYLPAQFASDKLSETGQKEKRYILLHEQIHIKRRDYIWRFIGYSALCLHWFNPMVWLAFFLSGKDMEMSCDEAVVRMLGENVKKEYSASLLSFASGRRIRLDIPLAFGEGETGNRIKNVLRYKKPAQAAIGIAIVICVAVIAALAANPGNSDGESGADDLGGEVYYGVVTYVELGDSPREVVTIPGLGEVEIPGAEEIYPYIEIEYFTKPEKGDLLAITFPEGEEVSIQETYPARFSIPAQSIAVMGQGFDIQRTDSGAYLFTVPWGYAREAEEGDLLVIYYYNDISADGGARTQLATVPVLSVDVGNYDVWVELSTDAVRTFLVNFGHGIECEIIEKGAEQTTDERLTGAPNQLVPEMLSEGSIGDGIYRVYARSLSRSTRGIDLYLLEGMIDMDESLPFLAFSQDCKFMVNREMETLRYEEVPFEEFADLAQETFFYSNPPMLLTFHEGLIVEAVLEDYYGAGISFALPPNDSWYAVEGEEMAAQLTAQEVLDVNYTMEHQIYLDVGDSEGMECIEVYAGNSGERGIVLVKNAGQDNVFTSIYAAGANTSRAGWNNIYLGNMDGYGFIMTLHIENRVDFGEYDYYVFRLSKDGETALIAGSSFYFDNRGIPYDDALFAKWTENLGRYLENSELILSTQGGELRTEMVSEADKYTYETLKP